MNIVTVHLYLAVCDLIERWSLQIKINFWSNIDHLLNLVTVYLYLVVCVSIEHWSLQIKIDFWSNIEHLYRLNLAFNTIYENIKMFNNDLQMIKDSSSSEIKNYTYILFTLSIKMFSCNLLLFKFTTPISWLSLIYKTVNCLSMYGL